MKALTRVINDGEKIVYLAGILHGVLDALSHCITDIAGGEHIVLVIILLLPQSVSLTVNTKKMENLEIVWNNITPIQRFYLLIDEVKLPEHEADKIKKIELN